MNPRDRRTLKNFFRDGALPSAQHYSDLIDSFVTWKDDGFDKSRDEGWRIAAVGERRALMSFYRSVGRREPEWMLTHGAAEGALELRRGLPELGEEGPSALSIGADGAVGIGADAPAWRLDVAGVARMRGRIGAPAPDEGLRLRADGVWRDVTEPLEGCHALEIVAGVGGKEGRGRYALLHAIALNAYNPRNRLLNWLLGRRSIRAQTAMFGSFADRLRLRWRTVAGAGDARDGGEEAPRGRDARTGERRYNRPYTLQIRTQADYGGDFAIRCHVTRLWFDSRMEGSRRQGVDRDAGVL